MNARIVPISKAADREPERPLEEREDDDLMRLARAGRSEAFDVLVRRHQRRVLAVAYRQVGDAALAQDIAQATFIELHRYLPKYRPEGKLPALLSRVALNQCRMHFRSRGARARMHASYPDRAPSAAPTESDTVLLERERAREVQLAVDGLSEKLRAVVALRYGADLPLEAIAEALELPVGTVKSRLFAGLAKLREQLLGDS